MTTMKKMRKNSGFTLVEMLIVVAIIAILVAVSIPLVTSSLGKAKEATDKANMRAAKAAGSIQFLSDASDGTPKSDTFYYDAASGTLQGSKSGITAYSQVDSGNIIKVSIGASGSVTCAWDTAEPGTTTETCKCTQGEDCSCEDAPCGVSGCSCVNCGGT